ncbi:MAG: ABC transporter permease, partial [Bryobacteraceae bacterium]
MHEVFALQKAETETGGGVMQIIRLWWETIAGIFRTAPGEHLSMLRQDVTYGLRMIGKNPGYTALALLTLSLGIGANTAIFSVLHSVLLQPLPYRDGAQLMVLQQSAPKMNAPDVPFSVPELVDYRAENHSFSDLVEYHSMNFTLLGRGTAERVNTGVVSASFFSVFGVNPILGRNFSPDDDKPGAPPVLLLSYEYWVRSQHEDPDIVGKTFEMNDKVHTVIGVLPRVPQYPDENDVYMPTSACPFRSSPAMITGRNHHMMSAFARLKPGVSLEQAREDMSAIAARFQMEYPGYYPDNSGFTADATPLKERLTADARPTLIILFLAAVFVLLIACANVANLTLARMARRERELVVRAALGAGQSRVLRQLVTEALLIALPAALLGLLIAGTSVRLLTQFALRLSPRGREIHVDGWVL